MNKTILEAARAVLRAWSDGSPREHDQSMLDLKAALSTQDALRPTLRQSHTYAALEVSAAAYDEIAAKLRAAGYGHAFDPDEGAINMHGIGLVCCEKREPSVCAWRAWQAAKADAAGPRREFDIEHLKAGIEGECGGLAITDQQARAILDYASVYTRADAAVPTLPRIAASIHARQLREIAGLSIIGRDRASQLLEIADAVEHNAQHGSVGDDVPCSKCGSPLDTGLECTECGHDMAPMLNGLTRAETEATASVAGLNSVQEATARMNKQYAETGTVNAADVRQVLGAPVGGVGLFTRHPAPNASVPSVPEAPTVTVRLARTAPHPECKFCHGTGVDGDVGPDGRTIDIDCMCTSGPPEVGAKMYREKCPDGDRCVHGCHTNERCHSLRNVAAPQPTPDLPPPAFLLIWRDGFYSVTVPNPGNTECYTKEQIAHIAAERDRYKQMDSEAAEHVEAVLCMRTGFTGEPPYVGWRGLGLALREALDDRDERRSVCESQMSEIERLREDVRRQAASAHKLLDTQLAQRTLNAELAAALRGMVEIAEMTIGWLPVPKGPDGPLIRSRAVLAKLEKPL